MAQDVIGTKLEITGEAQYRAKLNQAALALRNVASQDKVLQAQYAASDRSLAKLTQSMGLLQSKLDVQKQKLAAVKEEYDRVVAAEGENGAKAQKLAIDYNYASAAVETTTRQMRDLQNEIDAGTKATDDNSQAVTENAQAVKKSDDALQKHEARVKSNKEAIQTLGKAAEETGARIAKAAAAVTAAILTMSVKWYLQFGDQMAIVSTIADNTTVSMDELAAATLDASDRIGTAAKELATAEYDAISSGVDTAQAVGFVETAAKAAKAGLSDTTSVVKASTAIINAWGMAWSDSESVMDKLIVTQNVGVTTVDQLAGSIGDLTGLAPQLNVSLDEILAATAALTKNGYSTSKSMTALQGIMTAVLKPSGEAEKLAKSLGLQFDATAMQAKGLAGFLADVLDKTDGNATSLAVLFGQVEGLSGVMSLAGSASEDFSSSLAALGDSAGAMQYTFDKRMSSPAQRFALALNRMQNSAIRFGQTLAPYIDMAAGALERLANTIAGLSSAEQMQLLQVAGWTVGVAGMISVAGKLITSFKAIASVAGLLFSSPAGWIVLGISAIAALGIAIANASKAGSQFDKTWNTIAGHTDKATIDELSAKINVSATVSGLEGAQTTIDGLVTAIDGMYADVATALTDGLKDDPTTVANLKAGVHTKYQTLLDAVDAQLQEDLANLDPTDPDYDTKCQELIQKAEATRDALQQYETDYITWIDSYAGVATETVREHQGELKQITDQTAAAIAYIDLANQQMKSAGQTAFEMTAGGQTLDNDTIGKGFNYAIAKKNTGVADLEEQYAKDIADLQAKLKSGVISGKDYSLQEAMLQSLLGQDKQAVIDEYQQNLRDLFDGIAKASGNAGWGDEILAKLDAQNVVQGLLDKITSGEGLTADDLNTDAVKTALAQAFGEGFDPASLLLPGVDPKQTLVEAANQLTKDAAAALEGTDTPAILTTWFDTLMGVGAFEGMDTSTAEAQVALMAGNVGTATVDGYANAIADNAYKATDASSKMGDDTLDYLKQSLDVQSPSKETKKIGQYFVDGMVAGIASRTSLLYLQLRLMAAKMLTTMRNELEEKSPSRKTYAIGKYAAQGYINAIYDSIDRVQTATRRMVSVDGMMRGEPRAAAAQAPTVHGGNTYNIRYSAPLGRYEVNRFSRTLETVSRDALTSIGRKR